ncbi:hypothetical protein MAPG_11563 [Magnaporthiopsis poae ATCC 64411]|uniref:Uncharacterized protein n=1 Tax=Magnaporthiopsis poae (strain ATCC 64411 / 73-15) TaxID=644358 RepID=A0A0C4EFL2_MAGP6|nr:hypothetical protein MAPG_11563 [Magnaporthiopsis poae ATCC 64411]
MSATQTTNVSLSANGLNWNKKHQMWSIYRADWDSYYVRLTLLQWGRMDDDGYPSIEIFGELIQQYKDDGGDMGVCSSCEIEYPATMMSLATYGECPWYLCWKQTCTEKFRRAYADAPQLDEAFERGDTVMLSAHPDELFGPRKKASPPPTQAGSTPVVQTPSRAEEPVVHLAKMRERAAVIRQRETRFRDPRNVQKILQKACQKSRQA